MRFLVLEFPHPLGKGQCLSWNLSREHSFLPSCFKKLDSKSFVIWTTAGIYSQLGGVWNACCKWNSQNFRSGRSQRPSQSSPLNLLKANVGLAKLIHPFTRSGSAPTSRIVETLTPSQVSHGRLMNPSVGVHIRGGDSTMKVLTSFFSSSCVFEHRLEQFANFRDFQLLKNRETFLVPTDFSSIFVTKISSREP